MAIDLKRTYQERVDSTPLAVGSAVNEEGQGMVAVLVAGKECVMPSAGLAGETFAGFASFRQLSYSTAPFVENVTVPGAGPFEVQLQYNNIVAGQIRVYDVTTSTELTMQTLPLPAAGSVQVDYTSGKLTFNTTEQGDAMRVFYRWNLTVYQAQALFYQAVTNYPDPNYFGQVGVMKGKGRLYTSYYDAAIDWSLVAAGTIQLGANGILTVGGAGPLVPGGRVVYAPAVGVSPTASAQMLGIEWIA